MGAFIAPTVEELASILGAGRHAALYTSRKLVRGHDDQSSLSVAPRFIIAKGGITSSDLATGALAIKRARVLGQILPGIPVWQPDTTSRYSAGAYVVFPGNVGDDEALPHAVQILAK